jgi:AcrR family transcriptional regulator
MGIEDRKEREKEKMRQLIVKTAMNLFIEEGIDNVSLRRIADKIEYSPGSIYSYFKDKGEIIHAIHTEGFEKLYKLQKTLDSETNSIEKLSKMGELYMKFALENPGYYDLMFIAKGVAAKIYEKQEWDVGQRSYDYLKETVKQCIEQGFMIESDIDAATFAMWSFVHGMASLIIRGRCAMIPEEQIKQIVKGSLRFINKNFISNKEKYSNGNDQ